MCILIALVAISLVADPEIQWHYYGTFNIVIPSGVTIEQAKIVDESGDTYLDATTLPLECDVVKNSPSSMNNLEVQLSNGEIRLYTLIQTDETQEPPNGVPPVCRQIRLSLSGSQPSIPYDPTIPHYD
jgi:hypothetical protein